MSLRYGWDGSVVPDGEPPDAKITVWEVSPHPGDAEFDAYWERGYVQMQSYVARSLPTFFDRFTEEELRRGVTLTFRLIDMPKDELPDGY